MYVGLALGPVVLQSANRNRSTGIFRGNQYSSAVPVFPGYCSFSKGAHTLDAVMLNARMRSILPRELQLNLQVTADFIENRGDTDCSSLLLEQGLC